MAVPVTAMFPLEARRASLDRESSANGLFSVALGFAVFVFPFIGGIRGLPCMLGWLGFSLAHFAKLNDWSLFGLGSVPSLSLRRLSLFLSSLFGVAVAWCLIQLSRPFPLLTGFVLALPKIHQSLVQGRIWLFLVLIPFGQLTHELFYRGFLQQQLNRRLRTPAIAITLSTLLFAWTHVVIFSSLEFASDLRSAAPLQFGALRDTKTILIGVISYVMVESVLSGIALQITKSIWPSVLIRSSILLSICLVLFRRHGLI